MPLAFVLIDLYLTYSSDPKGQLLKAYKGSRRNI